ncbi:MAG: acetate--CoA ligase [Magnetococcales bacterium]|nr:acetate--CoA ligase [Magnetococcales bacterium]
MTEMISVLQEERIFKPDPTLSQRAHIPDMAAYKALVVQAETDHEAYWAWEAERLISWEKKWDRVLNDDNPPFYKWFEGGRLNASVNCIDRHLGRRSDSSRSGRKNKAAIIWEGEPGDMRTITYQELANEVNKLGNVLRQMGIKKGDRVVIYMPMIPEAAFAMLACARVGAVHNIVFGGFSAEALADRIDDAKAKLVITADGGWRRGAIVPLKDAVDQALLKCDSVEKVIVVERTKQRIHMHYGRDYWYDDLVAEANIRCEPESMEAEDPLFILYTSGSTGKPKGVLHTTGGYMVNAARTTQYVFDLQEDDTYWCTADIGWITGHTYVIYGPLALGGTSLMYEGVPTAPHAGRLWEIVEKYRVNIFYTAPTAIRALSKLGDQWPQKYNMDSLRILGTVGEPINPEAWMWYYRVIGSERCPIVDTYWQTETGSICISPLPAATPIKPGSCTLPLPGMKYAVVDNDGNPVKEGNGGMLVIQRPWPSMLRTVWGDDDRYVETYFAKFGDKQFYFAGDGARMDAEGYYWVMGRVDDVINVAGHRLGTMEIESALVSHPSVAEAAVVGRPDDVKGENIFAFVVLQDISDDDFHHDALVRELRDHVTKEIGPIAKPDGIKFTDNLPKTRSGKIMRRLLRDIASGRESKGDTSTLEDSTILEQLRGS